VTQSGENHTPLLGELNQQLPRVESAPLKPRIPPGRAARQINDALAANPSIGGFLPAGENTLVVISDDFTGKLGTEAVSIARSRNGSGIDAPDVIAADRKIRGDANAEKRAWRLTLAGFTGGAAAAAIVAVILAPQPVHDADYWWACIVFLAITSLILFVASYPRRDTSTERR
jgi:hypothetical protein